jgi:outer membrane protein OmpA-like peptidoglycan-associated protein
VHPNFPVLVVLHTSKASSAAEDEHHAERIAGVLRKGGAARVETRSVGSALPVADPQRSASAERNERLEIVFVSPN